MGKSVRRFPWKEYKPFFLIGGLVLVLIIAVAVISYFWPRYEERFFELGLLGRNKMAEDYYPNGNSSLEVGSDVLWYIYIHNHMGTVQDVLVRAKLVNSSMLIPDDREHVPSPAPFFFELPVSLDVDETKTIPFSWSILEADFQNDSIIINRLMVNNQTVNIDVSAFFDSRCRVVFELWVYDQSSNEYRFGWDSGEDFYSVSLYIWFSPALRTI